MSTASLIPREVAKVFVEKCIEAGLTQAETLVELETLVVTLFAYYAVTQTPSDPARWSQEMLDALAERAHVRIQEYLRGVRP